MTRAKSFWNNFSKSALDLLFPSRCCLCGDWWDKSICDTCFGEFQRPDKPVETYRDGGALDFRAAIFRYEGRAAQAVRRLKYSRITPLVPVFSAEIERAARELGLLDADLFVPVPIHWSRRAARGFNQSELLCQGLPTERVMPKAVLLRTRATRPQVGLSREQRLNNLTGAFAASSAVSGKRILLVDDVVTTLGTARECAKALKASGAEEVGVLAFAGEID